MAVSSLANVKVSAHTSNYTKGRQKKIRCIAIHHMAGVLSAEECGNIFVRAERNASTHYGIGNDGKIGNYIDESDTAWANSNWASNCESISIETSNSSLGGNWPVSDTAYNSLIKLVADIAKRNNLGTLIPGQNLIWHRMFVATSCPGAYLLSRMQDIADKANAINSGNQPLPARKSNAEIADEILAGKWGNGEDRKKRLISASYDYWAVQALVNQKVAGKAQNQANTATSSPLKVGDKVTLVSWVDYNGTRLARTRHFYYVSQINSSRVVLRADSMDGTIYAAVNRNNLRKV